MTSAPPGPGWWTPADLAGMSGLQRQSIRAALHRARKAWDAGWRAEGSLPLPDKYAGRVPVWVAGRVDVIAWCQTRKPAQRG